MGGSKGISGSVKAEMRRKQQELARGRKHQVKKTSAPKAAELVHDIKVLNTIGRSPKNLQQAWLCLQQCKTLHAVRRYSFPDCWQQAVGKGVLVLEGPLEWTTKVVSELRRTGYWRVGKRCLKCGAVSDKRNILIHDATCEGVQTNGNS